MTKIAELLFPHFRKIHPHLLKYSHGKLGNKLAGMPVITLITIGKSSGQPRSVVLTSPIQEGNNWIVVASKGGAPSHPLWYTNLLAHPQVQVILPGTVTPKNFIASDVPESQYPQYWEKIVEVYPGYAQYQKKTRRKIPIVLLTPA